MSHHLLFSTLRSLVLIVQMSRSDAAVFCDSHFFCGASHRLRPKRRLGDALGIFVMSLLPSLFRFCSQREATGKGIENFRVPERPGIINRYALEAPLIAIAHQVAIIAIHQQCVF